MMMTMMMRTSQRSVAEEAAMFHSADFDWLSPREQGRYSILILTLVA